MNRCVIVGGARIEDYGRIREALRTDDYIICCDCGLKHMEALGREPDLIVGDFDSYPEPETEIEKIVLPREKDDTDSVYAIKQGIARGYEDFLLIGAVGQRLDHSLVNVYALTWLYEQGKRAALLDDYSRMQIVGRETVTVPETYEYFSLVALTGKAEGVTIRGAKYELENGTIDYSYQYATSNEVTPGCVAEVSVQEGLLLLLEVYQG